MSQDWSTAGPNAELVDSTDVEEKMLQVPLTMKLDQSMTQAMKERVAKYFSTARLGRFSLGAPGPEDVKIVRKDLKYIPFWRIQGTYACRFARMKSYSLSVPDDVEEVRINGKLQRLVGQKRRLSDLIAEVGSKSGIGYGPVRLSLAPLQSTMKSGLQHALGSRDKELSRSVEIELGDVEELASFAQEVNFCYNANLGGEDPKMFEALRHTPNLQPLSRDVKENCVEVNYGKESALSEFKKIAVKEPDISPSRIMEHQVGVQKLELVHVPFYDLVVEAKGQRKMIKLNALTGEDSEL